MGRGGGRFCPKLKLAPRTIGVILGGTRESGPPTFWRAGDGPPLFGSTEECRIQTANCVIYADAK